MIYFTPDLYGGISRVSQDGGAVQPVTELDKAEGEKSHRWPALLPGGKALVYAALTGRAWDGAQIVLKRLDTGERKVLIRGGTSPLYAPTGHLVYAREGSLYAVRFDLSRLEVAGQPVEVTRDVYLERSGAAGATFTPSGLLVYIPSSSIQSRRLLTRVDRTGAGAALTDRREAFAELVLSPDGTRIALEFDSTIWTFDVARKTFMQLTSGARAQRPVWTPDGRTILYAFEKSGPWNVFSRPADGSGTEQQLWPSSHVRVARDVSPDGKSLLLQEGNTQGLRVATLPPAEGAEPRTLSSAARPLDGRFSPDGRWIAYSDEGPGRPEILVVPASGGEGKWQISTQGGTQPRWNRSGKEIFYLHGENLMAVPVQTQPRFEPGVPVKLFSKSDLQYFDVEADGEHFVLLESPDPATETSLGAVVNWFSRLAPQAERRRDDAAGRNSARSLRDPRAASARAGWARCTRRATRGSSARWRSRCCRSISRPRPKSASGSSARRRRSRSSRTRTSARSTTSAREGDIDYLVMELPGGRDARGAARERPAAARADAALRRRDRRRARQGAPAGDRASRPEARQRHADRSRASSCSTSVWPRR